MSAGRRGRITVWPWLIVAAGTGYVAVVWLLLLVVDRNYSDPDASLWAWAFSEAGPTERIQWVALFACAVVCLVGLRRTTETTVSRFLGLMGYGTLLMLAEDAVNLSHAFAFRVAEYGDRISTMAARSVVFSIVAALPVWAFVRYWRKLPAGRTQLATGFVLYGLAAVMSVPANLLGVYQRLGPWVIETLGIPSASPGHFDFPEYDIVDTTGVAFLDLAVEESLELLGATFLLAGLLSLALAARSTTTQLDPQGGPTHQR